MSKPKVYGDDEVPGRLEQAGLDGWRLQDGVLRRDYATDGWPTTLMLVNAIGFVAEAAFHHPDLAVSYASVGVTLATHSAGGITDMDFALARRIEDLALWRPSESSPLGGTSKKYVFEPDA